MKGFVDKNTCIGCGLCAALCPEIFEMEVDGKAEASKIDIEDNLIERAKEAEEQCPVSVITIQ